MQMAKQCFLKRSNILVIMEIQIKTLWGLYITHARVIKNRNTEDIKCYHGCRERETLFTGGSVNWLIVREINVDIPQKAK